MNPFVRYTLMRILLFGAVLAFLAALHVGGIVLFAGSLLISAALSYLLLNGPRRAVVERIEQRVASRAGKRAPDRDSLVEDAQIDRAEVDRAQAIQAKAAQRELPRSPGKGHLSIIKGFGAPTRR